MAKRKQSPVTEPVSGRPIYADSVLADVTRDVEAKSGKQGHLVGSELMVALPVPALSTRYLLQNEGLPLSRVFQVVGERGSYKSSLGVEIVRWHRLCGGAGVRCEAETKDPIDLRQAILNYDDEALRNEECVSLDEWQRKITWYTRFLQKRLLASGGPGKTIPYCLLVDSLAGKACERTIDRVTKDGAAGLSYPLEANMINTYLKVYPQLLLGWPFTFVGINHLKISRDPDTGLPVQHMQGGKSLEFQCAAIIALERIGRIAEFSTYKAANVAMELLKNSYGQDHVRIQVRFKTWLQEDAAGVFRLHARFEWWEASILLIGTGLGMRKSVAASLLPKLRDVCDIHEVSAGSAGKMWYSKRLGVSKDDAMPAHDLGMLLETKPDVLADLYPLMGIQRRPYFRPGVDFMSQLSEHAHVVQQADMSADLLSRAQNIQQQLFTATPANDASAQLQETDE
jgi:hypothetical protein